jgi:hypothetical protein
VLSSKTRAILGNETTSSACRSPIRILKAIRRRCASLPEEFPPTEAGHYCGPRGIEVIEAYILERREKN